MAYCEEEELNRDVKCPICKDMTRWGSMIWLSGQCTCQKCYRHKLFSNDQSRMKDLIKELNNSIEGSNKN